MTVSIVTRGWVRLGSPSSTWQHDYFGHCLCTKINFVFKLYMSQYSLPWVVIKCFPWIITLLIQKVVLLLPTLIGSIFIMMTSSNENIFRVTPHKGQWRGALIFSLISTWINSWVNNPEAGDLRRHRAHCDVSVMILRRPEMHAISPYTEADNGSIKDILCQTPPHKPESQKPDWM